MDDMMIRLIEAIENLARPSELDGISIILSAVAILIAFDVPRRVAKEQNKIALFDKRVEVYMQLTHIFNEAETRKSAFDQQKDLPDAMRIVCENNMHCEDYEKTFIFARLLFPEKIQEKINRVCTILK